MVIKPDEAGLSAERLERVTSHLERRYIDPGKISGCQVVIARKGHVAYFRSFGAMDLESTRAAGRVVTSGWRLAQGGNNKQDDDQQRVQFGHGNPL